MISCMRMNYKLVTTLRRLGKHLHWSLLEKLELPSSFPEGERQAAGTGTLEFRDRREKLVPGRMSCSHVGKRKHCSLWKRMRVQREQDAGGYKGSKTQEAAGGSRRQQERGEVGWEAAPETQTILLLLLSGAVANTSPRPAYHTWRGTWKTGQCFERVAGVLGIQKSHFINFWRVLDCSVSQKGEQWI